MPFLRLFSVCLCLVFLSCETKQSNTAYSFYHWKTNLELTEKDKTQVTESASNTLYVRFFDIHFNSKLNEALPAATLQRSKNSKIPVDTIIPVVFIKNEVFKQLDIEKSKALAKPLSEKIRRLIKNKFKSTKVFPEIQIDCDWSETTKIKYFSFLEVLHTYFEDIEVSATLRLHQVKYKEKTGVPPVDKVVLMAYNVGDISNIEEKNSIINNDITKQYLERLNEYPMHYDVALPLFQWAVLYRRNQAVAILNDYTQQTFKDNFTSTKTLNVYKASQDCYISGNFIYKDDIVRVETVSKSNLKALAELIKSASNKPYKTIFYHIGSPTVFNFTSDDLKSYCYN